MIAMGSLSSLSKALVAFTDVVKDAKDGQEYTEAKMIGFPEAATGDRFEGDEYRFLIVASKFPSNLVTGIKKTFQTFPLCSNRRCGMWRRMRRVCFNGSAVIGAI